MKRKSTQQKNKKTLNQAKQAGHKTYDNTYSLEAYREQRDRKYINPYEKKDNISYKSNYRSAQEPTRNYINPYDTNKSYNNPYSTNKSYNNPYSTNKPYNNPYEVKTNNGNLQGVSKSNRTPLRTKHQLSRKESVALKKKRHLTYRRKMLITLFLVTILVYGIIKMVDLFTYPTISYQTAQIGSIDNSVEHEGLILRHEKVYSSSLDGNVHYLTNEGEKVKKQGQVCYVTKDSNLMAALEEVDQIDNSIYTIQDKRKNLSSYQPELNTLNEKIKNEVASFYTIKENTDTQPIYLLRKQLERTIQSRTDIYIKDTTERTDELGVKRQQAIASAASNQQAVLSEAAGLVSYYIDGMEQSLTPEQMEQINQSDYKRYLKKDKEISHKALAQTTKGSALYKLITEDRWYVMTYIDKADSAKYEEGKRYPLYFTDFNNDKVAFTLRLKQEEEKQLKLIFETREKMNTFLAYRTAQFTIGKNKASGLKIPLTAIVEKNLIEIPESFLVMEGQNQKVLRKTNETVESIPVNVQYTENDKAYILQEIDKPSALLLNQVIQNPTTKLNYKVESIHTLQGVYTVNGRYAKFKKIVIEMMNSEYAIVNEQESKLKVFDQIISNPKSIKEDQLLKYMNIQNE